MRRILAVLGLVLLIIGGFGLWWYLRDTPAKVLRDGFTTLTEMRSAKKFNVDIAITDSVTHVTTGFTSLSEVDVSDLTHPRSLGILRIGARTATEHDQTIDAILEKDLGAFRPRDVDPQYRSMYQTLTGDTTGTTFLTFNRNSFLKSNGYAEAVAGGTSADVRAALPYLLPILVPGDHLAYSADKSQVLTNFLFDRRTVKPFLIVFVHAWAGDNPTVDEYAWIDRATEDMGRGVFSITLDRATRRPILLTGDWPIVDDQGNAKKNVHATLDLDGLNEPVGIGIPGATKDVTAILAKPENISTLPTSGAAASSSASFNAGGAGGVGGSGGAYVTSVGNGVPVKDIDLFQKYSDELKKKKNLY